MAMAVMHRVTSGPFAAVLSAMVVGAASLHFREQSPPPAALAGRPAPLDRAIPPTQTGTRANGAAVRVTVKPDPVYVERSEIGQHLNFEFLLGNLTDEELLLTGIEVSIFDDGGRLARRDFVNRFSRTSLEIPPRRVLRTNQTHWSSTLFTRLPRRRR